VNDAEHLVGATDVEVSVLSTRPTSQGMLVFAQVLDQSPMEEDWEGPGRIR